MKSATRVMARNQEKFRSISIGKFQIKDSLEHIPASLDSLVEDLCKDKSFAFPILSQFETYAKLRQRKKMQGLKLLKRKGVYPYEHFTSYNSLKMKKFPSKEAFYSRLNETHITDEDYKHGQKVFKFFGCKSMEDYMKLYCGLDVILLAEVFIKYREMVIQHFELDPVYYLGKYFMISVQSECDNILLFILITGIPGLSFDVMLKMFYEDSKKELEERPSNRSPGSLDLFHDPAMEQFFTKGIRGGQSFIATRHAKGNADPKTPGDHLLYVDGK